jgi:YHS domain-containing protein
MMRNLFRLLLVLIAGLFVRQVVAVIVRAFNMAAGGSPSAQPTTRAAQSGGELKKDPVCGTFVAVSSSIKRDVDGQVLHFCSTTCRDKYQVA